MKIRIFTIVVMALLLTGCTQKAEDNGEGVSTTQTAKEADENGGTDETRDVGEGNVEEEGTATEEAYVLTFEAATMEGEAITSECFARSKLTMLNVWATYCNPCLSEMPDLGELAASYDTEEFQIFGIVCDVVEEDGDAMEYARELIVQTGADYPHLPLNQSLYSNLVGGVDSVPTTFFVNQKGELLGYVLGAQSKETWEEIISSLLAEME